MDFIKFQESLNRHVTTLAATAANLYVTDADGDQLWQIYLTSLGGANPKFRERTEHDCNCCRHFLRRFGTLVVIDPTTYEAKPVLDFTCPESGYQPTIDALVAYIKTRTITNVFVSLEKVLGTPITRSVHKPTGTQETWHHLNFSIPKAMVYTRPKDTVDTYLNDKRTSQSCLERALRELTPASVSEVLELVTQGTLYRGESWKKPLQDFQALQTKYAAAVHKANFAWFHAPESEHIARIRNSSIGTLLVDLSGGMDLEDAVRRYEAVTAPTNYQRPTALVTPAMVEKARKTIEELGVLESLPHRFARLEDVTIQNVLFANRAVQSTAQRLQATQDPLAELSASLPKRKKLERTENISWEKFRDDVLPTSKSLEVLLEPRLMPNMVSLLAPINPASPRVFKWDNGFCWTYAGNLADSGMKEKVKAAGGKVDGVLRFSIQWNENKKNPDDLDAYCTTPAGERIYFGDRRADVCGGELDVDIRFPSTETAVENITWPALPRMRQGTYTFHVNDFAHRGGTGGFRAEIEFEGQIHSFDYQGTLRTGMDIPVATVTLKADRTFSIVPAKGIEVTQGCRKGVKLWGIESGAYHPVTAAMYSPNFWDGQEHEGGHRHVFFMLNGCVNPENPNGFYNEYLRGEFVKHRKVFEALGGKMKVAPDDKQLSGVGFSTSKRNTITIRVKGQTERTFTVAF